MRHSNGFESSIYSDVTSGWVSSETVKLPPLALALTDKLFNVGDDI